MSVTDLPHVNAALNTCACLLLLLGYRLIRARRELAHRRVMLACFATSTLFLGSYLVYHANVGSKPFPTAAPGWLRYTYYGILLTHVVLAAAVPFLAIVTIYLGLRDRRATHRRWARITFPIWLYVSITGVLVYLALYWVAPRL